MPRYEVHMHIESKTKRVSWYVEASNPDEAYVKAAEKYRAFLSPEEEAAIYEISFIGYTPDDRDFTLGFRPVCDLDTKTIRAPDVDEAEMVAMDEMVAI